MTKAAAGTTIVVRGGTYQETVEFPYGRRLTLQNYPGEAVWLDGSDQVTGWVADGTAWRRDNWTAEFDYVDPDPDPAISPFEVIDPSYPMAGHPDMVFIDGVPQRQVGSRDAVVAGTFFVDYATNQLFIGASPVGRQVRASTREEAIIINQGSGSIIRGIGVRRYATPMAQKGALRGYADQVVLENLVVEHNASAGVSVIGQDIQVRNLTIRDNGQLGLHGHWADGLDVDRTIVSRNNVERFVKSTAAGGVKLTSSRHVVVRDSKFEDNYGTAIWIDESSYDVKLINNLLRRNLWHGVNFEISARGIIANNVVVGSAGAGVQVLDSNNVRLWNNTFVRNWRHVYLLDGPRDSSNPDARGHDTRYGYNPEITWIVKGIVMRNNILSDRGDATVSLFAADDKTKTKTGADMVTMDFNAYYRRSTAEQPVLLHWANWPTNRETYYSFTEFRSRTRQEFHGIAVDDVSDPFFVDQAAGDFRLRGDSFAKAAGTPLPSDIALLLAVPSGQPDIGALLD